MGWTRGLGLVLLIGGLGLAPLLAAGPARADVAPSPIMISVEGADSRSRAAPEAAEFTLTNRDDRAVEVFLFQAVLTDDATRTPMRIEGVEVGGRAASRTVTVPAGGTLRVRVRFTVPSHARGRARWTIELATTSDASGGTTTRPAVVTRDGRGPEKWAVDPLKALTAAAADARPRG